MVILSPDYSNSDILTANTKQIENQLRIRRLPHSRCFRYPPDSRTGADMTLI
jgi:hypothetical protein